jgi:hypothetical protein
MEPALDRFAATTPGPHRHPAVLVAGPDLVFREVAIDGAAPTARQVAHAAGSKPPDDAIVLHQLPDGELTLLLPSDPTVLPYQGESRFVVVQGDHIDLLRIDGIRYDWPCRFVSGRVLRRLGSVPHDRRLFLRRADGSERQVGERDLVDLDMPGIETFVTGPKTWHLNVQGVVIDVAAPRITARAALEAAGFDVRKPWHIFLKVAGQPKVEIALDYVIDLEAHGIEKLRLLPRNVDNGEAPLPPQRDFALLEVDENHLDRLRLRWETVVESDGRRWLLISAFPLPPGYTVETALLALEIPSAYPGAQIYGFYAHPELALSSGAAIRSTQLVGVVRGKRLVGWSRHRPGQPWDPANDNVVTQLCLVEAALTKEVGQ